MASALALRAILGASLGLGAIDLLWIDVLLAPRVVAAPAPVAAPPRPVAPVAPAPAAQAPATEPSVRAQQVYFATASDHLDPAARATLDQIAPRSGRFVLSGRADRRGDDRSNAALRRARASAVAAYLTEHGVDPERIEIRDAADDDASHAGELWRDRRVDIEIIGGLR